MKPCPFNIPEIKINRIAEQSFSSVQLRELFFASMSCDQINTVYEILYPDKVWACVQTYKAKKAFMDETKTYYEVYEDVKHYIEEPLSADEEMTLYHSYDQNHNSMCLAIHEEFANGETCVLHYKDGPRHHLLHDGDNWQSQSLVYEEDEWVLDIACQNTVSANWVVTINGKEMPCMQLSVLAVPYRGKPQKAMPPEFVNQYYYNAEGDCVLQRRYMGSVWREWKSDFWQKIKTGESIEESGERFYLYCDYVPEKFL